MSTHPQSKQTTRCYARNSNRRKAALDLNALPPEALLPEVVAAPVEPPQRPVSPIDIEAIEDEVVILPSSTGLPQARKRPRRKHPLVVIDDGLEIHAGRSGSLNNHNKLERIPESRTFIDCEVYSTCKDDHNAKRKKVMNACPPPKEPTLSCPVCLDKLAEACSTICGHVFCQSCIKLSIQKMKRCPTCRKPLNMKNFHRLYLPTTD